MSASRQQNPPFGEAPTRIVLADDHQLVREGLKVALSRMAPSIEVLEAASIDETIDHLHQEADLALIILDLRMPGMNGLAGLDRVRDERPEVPVVILSASSERRDVVDALQRGASGYIPKSLSVAQTVAAIEQVLQGDVFYPRLPQAASTDVDARFVALSPRERHVLTLLAEGCSNKEIARRLLLQEVTVKAHLRQVFRKLGVANRTQAVKLVLQLGWTE